jgi:hypothetical protein
MPDTDPNKERERICQRVLQSIDVPCSQPASTARELQCHHGSNVAMAVVLETSKAGRRSTAHLSQAQLSLNSLRRLFEPR